MTLTDLFSALKAPPSIPNDLPTPVFYLQSQNGNLSTPPLSILAPDIGQAPDFATQVFGMYRTRLSLCFRI